MLSPASGIGTYTAGAKLAIRLLRQGCTNRPFFHIVVAEVRIMYFCMTFLKGKYFSVKER